MNTAPVGLVNFRDVGGMPLTTGGTTSDRVLLRSAAPAGISDQAWRTLDELGVATLIDLRSPSEREQAPTQAPAGTKVLELPLLEGAMTAEAFAKISGDHAGVPGLGQVYADLLADGGEVFAQVARTVATTDRGVLVHCTAGKDRTGVAVALILDAVGVRRDFVVADYAATAAQLTGPWTERMLASMGRMGLPISDELTAVATDSPAPVMEELLARLDDTDGGAAGYLSSNGLAEGELRRLRQRLACG